jgi:MoxR-like ATPase
MATKFTMVGVRKFDANKPAEAAMTGPATARPQLGYLVKKTERGIIWPMLDRNFHVRREHTQMLEAIEEMSKEVPVNIRLTGPQGCGKTETAVYFAALYERPVYIINCAVVRENKDWFGYKTVKDGQVIWVESDFVRAVKMERAVILLDEFNRLHSTVVNSLMPLLDRRRQTFVDELGEMLNVAEGVVFFATTNVGHAFTGTFTMDAAHQDRFAYTIESDFLDEEDEVQVLVRKTGIIEEDARKLCQFAKNVRAKCKGLGATLKDAVSTRQLLQAAMLMRQFREKRLPIKTALDFTVYPCYSADGDTDSDRAQVRLLANGIFKQQQP